MSDQHRMASPASVLAQTDSEKVATIVFGSNTEETSYVSEAQQHYTTKMTNPANPHLRLPDQLKQFNGFSNVGQLPQSLAADTYKNHTTETVTAFRKKSFDLYGNGYGVH